MISATNLRDITNKFIQYEASILEVTNKFAQLVDDLNSRCDFSKDEDRAADVKILLSGIYKFLQCIIAYAECGFANKISSDLYQFCNKICEAVEDLKIKNEFLEHLTIPILEILFCQPSWITKEILRMYNTAIQNTDKNVRSRVINMKSFHYLGELMRRLPFGDIDFQLILLQTIMSLLSKEALQVVPIVNFQRDEHKDAFYSIDMENFHLTARIFLNILNKTENHVVSLLCNRVTFDYYLLQKPHELDYYHGLWVDFNVKAGSVTLFINDELSNKNPRWEMITIFSENIDKYDILYVFNEEKEKIKGVAKILLKGPCQMIYAAASHRLHNFRLLTLNSIDIKTFDEVFKKAFPKIQKGIKQTMRARSLIFKQDYNPLEVVSAESSATISTRTLEVTTDAGYVEETRMSGSSKSIMAMDEDVILLSSTEERKVETDKRNKEKKKKSKSNDHDQKKGILIPKKRKEMQKEIRIEPTNAECICISSDEDQNDEKKSLIEKLCEEHFKSTAKFWRDVMKK